MPGADEDTVESALRRGVDSGEGLESERMLATLRRRLASVDEPARLGHYTVIERIGAGAMGIVYTAYDSRLDRKVAIKLILDADGGTGSAGRERLRREAEALARVSHENVVEVFEVGDSEGRPFIAMEFIRGTPLNEWLLAQPRSWRDVLRVFIRVGAGLAAIHRSGLLHRDFKPNNVIVGADGRPRIVDFGLTRAERVAALEEPGVPSASVEDPLARTLTVEGTLVGTPAYMSLEQARGQRLDERSDQFSFCVALYEALYGQQPYACESFHARLAALEAGAIREPPDGTSVPVRVWRTVQRGLSRDAAERFESMAALLRRLGSAARGRARRRTVAAIAVGGLGAIAAVVFNADPRCASGPDRLEPVWGHAARAELAAGFAASRLNYAQDTWQRVEAGLDAYAAAWTSAYGRSCREDPPDVIDLRMGCLGQRLRDLEVFVTAMGSLDGDTVRNAVDALGRITPIDACADVERLRARVPPPSDEATAALVASVRAELERVHTLDNLGRAKETEVLADNAVARSRDSAYPPVIAEALLRRGFVAVHLASPPEAIEWLEQAFFAAARASVDDVAARAAIQLVRATGLEGGDVEEAEIWLRLARAHTARADDDGTLAHAVLVAEGDLFRARGDEAAAAASYQSSLDVCPQPDARHRSSHYGRLATALGASGQLAAGLAARRRALALSEEGVGPRHPDVGKTLLNLGADLNRFGRSEDAIEMAERGVAIVEAALGPDHRDVGIACVQLSSALLHSNRASEAVEQARKAVELLTPALGEDHPSVLGAMLNHAVALDQIGHDAASEEETRRVLAIADSVETRTGPSRLRALENLGHLLNHQGREQEALEFFNAVIPLLREKSGAANPRTLNADMGLCAALNQLGRHDEALQRFEAMLELAEAAHGTDHIVVGRILVGLGRTLLSLHRHAEAVAPLERAREILAQGQSPVRLGRAEEALADALWPEPAQRPRAVELAEHARTLYRRGSAQVELARVELWLESAAGGRSPRRSP